MAALIKAVLVNSGRQLTGVEATRQGIGLPSMDQGFGSILLNNTMPTTSANLKLLHVGGNYGTWCSNCVNVSTGQSLTYQYQARGVVLLGLGRIVSLYRLLSTTVLLTATRF